MAGLFNQYDLGLLSLLLMHIQSDLAIAENQLGFMGSAIRLGSLATLALAWLADRHGRRRMLLLTIVGYTFFTGVTALAPDAATFVASQFAARMFMTAELLLAAVVIVEELQPAHRAWGIAMVGVMSMLGRGVAAGLFAAVDVIPMGWRGLYLVGVLPLLAIAVLRRGLPETRSFVRLPASRRGASFLDSVRALGALVRARPARFAAVGGVTFLWSASNAPVDFFLPKFVQEVHGWSPADLAEVMLTAGGLGISGMLVAGRISDRFGRRPSTVGFMLLEPLGSIALFSVAGPVLVPLFAAWVFSSVANDVVGGTYARELFPTSTRATVGGLGAIVGTLGSAFGLAAEGVLFGLVGEHWTAVRLIAALGLAMPLIVALTYPETSGRELDEIAPEVV